MTYASSYADGSSQLEYREGGQPRLLEAPALLAPPRPTKLHWTTILLVVGLSICAVALLATIAGVPAKMGYDVNGAPDMNKPSSSDPMKITQSLDGNMKWINQASSDTPSTYLGLTKSINRSEGMIAPMVQAVVLMDASVRSIDAGLGEVTATTAEMSANMAAMAKTSSASADAMTNLSGDIGFLSRSMVDLATSTQELTERMASIERRAGGIAKNGTASARKTAAGLNRSLPNDVPVPLTSDGRPLDQVMAEMPGVRGGGIDDFNAGAIQ